MASQMKKEPKLIGPYQIGEVIGFGACGKVFKGLNIEKQGQLVAIKQVSLNYIKEDRKGSIRTEINLLKNLQHPKIVKYIDSIYTEDHLNIVLEYVENGSLDSLVKKFGKIPETLIVFYIQQMLEGLEFLHENNCIHRDIKGGNILTTKDGEVKLADFGVATILSSEQNTLQKKNISFAGTPYWMAPEVIQEHAEVTSACDIWSLGCTVIELLTGKPPYYDLHEFTAMIKIVYEGSPPLPDNISENMRDFLTLCFERNPVKRIDAKGLLKHKLLNQVDKKTALEHIISSENQLKLPKELTNTIKMHLDKVEGMQSTSRHSSDEQPAHNQNKSTEGPPPHFAGQVEHVEDPNNYSFQPNSNQIKNSNQAHSTHNLNTYGSNQAYPVNNLNLFEHRNPGQGRHQHLVSPNHMNDAQHSHQHGSASNKFRYIPQLTEQPPENWNHVENDMLGPGHLQYNSHYQRHKQRQKTQYDQSQMGNWVSTKAPQPEIEQKHYKKRLPTQVHHSNWNEQQYDFIYHQQQQHAARNKKMVRNAMPLQVQMAEHQMRVHHLNQSQHLFNQHQLQPDSRPNMQQTYIHETQMAHHASEDEYGDNMHEGSSSLSSLELDKLEDEDKDNFEQQENLIQFQQLVPHPQQRVLTQQEPYPVQKRSRQKAAQILNAENQPFHYEQYQFMQNQLGQSKQPFFGYQPNDFTHFHGHDQPEHDENDVEDIPQENMRGRYQQIPVQKMIRIEEKKNQQRVHHKEYLRNKEEIGYLQERPQRDFYGHIEYNQHQIRQATQPDFLPEEKEVIGYQHANLRSSKNQMKPVAANYKKNAQYPMLSHVPHKSFPINASAHMTPMDIKRKSANVIPNANAANFPREPQTASRQKSKKAIKSKNRFMSTVEGIISEQADIKPKKTKQKHQSYMVQQPLHNDSSQINAGQIASFVNNGSEEIEPLTTMNEDDKLSAFTPLIQQLKSDIDTQLKPIFPQFIQAYKQQQTQHTSMARSVVSKNQQVIDQYNKVANQITERIRQLVAILKNLNEKNENVEAQVIGGQQPVNARENQTSLSEASRANNEEPNALVQSQKSNLSAVQVKLQVMEQLSPLRLVDVLGCSYWFGVHNLSIQFATLQLINQICDDAPKNYKLICLSGLLSHLKEFSKDTALSIFHQAPNQEITQKEIKVEVAYFILKAYVTSNDAVMMIFSSQGYKILGQFLAINEFDENKLLIFMAIDVFLLHFDHSIQSVLLPQTELANIFSRENVSDKLAKIIPRLIQGLEAGASEEEPVIAQKYIDKTFDLLLHLQNGNEEVKMQFCSKELMQECLVKQVRAQMQQRNGNPFQMLIIKRFMKLLQNLVTTEDDCQPLFEKLYQSNVLPCLVEILKYFFQSIESIQMTLIYDILKLLSLLCSFSPTRTQQASQFGLLETLKQLIIHILKLNDQFSQNKRVKLFRQILLILQDNINYGNEFTKVEMLNQGIHVQLLRMLQSSAQALKQSSTNLVQTSPESLKVKKSHFETKIEKDHEICQKVVELISLWLAQKSFVQLDKLEKQLQIQSYISGIHELTCHGSQDPKYKLYAFESILKSVRVSTTLALDCFIKNGKLSVFEKLIIDADKQVTTLFQILTDLKKDQRLLSNNDQSEALVVHDQPIDVHFQILSLVVMTIGILVQQVLDKEEGYPTGESMNAVSEKMRQSGDDEHLETDIVDDEDEIDAGNLRINQINILNSQASASQAPLMSEPQPPRRPLHPTSSGSMLQPSSIAMYQAQNTLSPNVTPSSTTQSRVQAQYQIYNFFDSANAHSFPNANARIRSLVDEFRRVKLADPSQEEILKSLAQLHKDMKSQIRARRGSHDSN